MAKFYSYAQIEDDLPVIVKVELQRQDDLQRRIFAEEFGKKRKTMSLAYRWWLSFCLHRWYLGNPGVCAIQIFLILFYGVGLIWAFVDLFLIPGMVRDKNSEIAKSVLAEQKILAGGYGGGFAASNQQQQPTIINVSNK